ncbi:MAG: DUF86 domain-containing protein [Phycisphaeraceae bacterium]|nr:DUF86 domain-containing protein [Phycisphaeraceae bacterium]
MPRERNRGPFDDRVRVEHMLLAARDAARFVRGRSRDDLNSDAMLLRAVWHAIQQIGEAAAHISDAGRDRVPGIPWGQIVAMRHVLVQCTGAWTSIDSGRPRPRICPCSSLRSKPLA